MNKINTFIPRTYNSTEREMIQLSIMVQSFTPKEYTIEECFEGNYLRFIDSSNKKHYLHWAHLLYGYVAHKILKEAYDNNIFEDWETYTTTQNDILYSQILENYPPFEILWDLFKDIQRIYSNTNYEELLEIIKLRTYLKKSPSKGVSSDNTANLFSSVNLMDKEENIIKKPIPLPEGEPKKTIVVKGFKPSTSSNIKLLNNNISEQIL